MHKLYRTLSLVFTFMLFWQGVAWGQMETIQQGTILHCFDWKYTDIQASLQTIKDAGFTAVQTSPAQSNYTGSTSWNTLYRPRDTEIGPNSIGTKAELQALCTAAHQLGIKVIVDVVANHTDGSLDWVADFWKNTDLYHTLGGVSNWNDRYQVTHGEIGMKDLKTEDPRVQQKFKDYVQKLKAVGVDGIRWDAAKHIGLPSEGDNFWPTVIDKDMFNYGEILNNTGGDDSKLIPEYMNYMSVTDTPYGTSNVLGSAKNGQATPYGGGNYTFSYNTNKVVYWGESHDTYCNKNEASYGVSQAVVDRAYAVAASHNNIPALYLSRPSDNSTTDGPSAQVPHKGSTHFTSKAVAEVNLFHNAMDGKADYYTANGSVASITRKDGGAIVVNFGGSGNVSIANGGGYATPGTYTDKVSGNTWTITSSTISGQTDNTGIAVLYSDVPSTAANITLSPNGGTFTTETQSVTLTPNDNTASYWYQIGTGSKQTVSDKNPTTVTLGSGVDYGTSITLSWGAINAEGEEKTGSATYTKQDPNAALSVYVEAATAPYIYVWYTDPTTKANVEPNGTWSNTKAMTAYSNGWYVYTLPAGVTSYNFILQSSTSRDAKLTDNVENVTGTVYYKVSGSTASVTEDRPGKDNPDPTPSSYEPTLKSADEVSVFFETSKDNVKVWIWDANNGDANYTGGSWPGESMTLKGKAANGNNIFKWTYSGTLTAIPTNIIFTHDGETKFNQANGTFTNHGYYTESSAITSTKTITKVDGGDDPKPNPDPDPDPKPDPTPSDGVLASYYKTNPNGAGKKKTITVDGDLSDWSASDIIAQGAANDDPRVYMPSSVHEVPTDLYALYGAYDENNVYLAWEMTNVQDVIASSQDFPMTQGNLWIYNLPFWIGFQTGDNATLVKNAKTPWDDKYITFSNGVNRMLAVSTNGANGPYVYDGNGTELYNAKTAGCTFEHGQGIKSTTVYGINGYGQSRSVGDMKKENESSADWVDFDTKGHNSSKLDMTYEISIPLKDLGISASDIQNKGLGVMLVATFGASGMDCLPYDLTMNDNADQPYSADPTTTEEKEDQDVISARFAAIGNLAITGIKSIKADTNDNASAAANAWYTISGTRLSGKPAQRGVYIHGGKKVVIK